MDIVNISISHSYEVDFLFVLRSQDWIGSYDGSQSAKSQLSWSNSLFLSEIGQVLIAIIQLQSPAQLILFIILCIVPLKRHVKKTNKVEDDN